MVTMVMVMKHFAIFSIFQVMKVRMKIFGKLTELMNHECIDHQE